MDTLPKKTEVETGRDRDIQTDKQRFLDYFLGQSGNMCGSFWEVSTPLFHFLHLIHIFAPSFSEVCTFFVQTSVLLLNNPELHKNNSLQF